MKVVIIVYITLYETNITNNDYKIIILKKMNYIYKNYQIITKYISKI